MSVIVAALRIVDIFSREAPFCCSVIISTLTKGFFSKYIAGRDTTALFDAISA